MRLEALDGEALHLPDRSTALVEYPRIADCPLRHRQLAAGRLPVDDVDDLVAIDDQCVSIWRNRLGCRYDTHTHESSFDHDAIRRRRRARRSPHRTDAAAGKLRMRTACAIDP